MTDVRAIIEQRLRTARRLTPPETRRASCCGRRRPVRSRCSDRGEARVAEPAATAAGASTSGSRRPCCSTSALHDNRGHGCRRPALLRQACRSSTPPTTPARFRADGVRVVPGAVVREGAHVAPDAVLMPSFVNIGAYVGAGTMVDTWATVGSCAQIGRNVHLSGGVGIGGVLEPLQAQPTIIEDDCFIGARSEVVEGVVVERGSVISMGVFIGAEHAHLRPRTRTITLRPRTRRLRRRPRQPARRRRRSLAVLRGDRQERRRTDARQDLHQRLATDVNGAMRGRGRAGSRS